jgi:ketosteroid isomerase-like protein
MSEKHIDIAAKLEAAYEALSVDDVGLFLAAFSPTARWSLQGNIAGLPFAGMKSGHAEIRRMIRRIYDEFKMRDFFIEDIIVGDTSAAVRWSALATSKQTGRQQHLEVFDHLMLHEGLIVSLTQFYDTAAVADAAGRMQRISQELIIT